jgi:uncharacterized protein YjgD (DUF1641 family)
MYCPKCLNNTLKVNSRGVVHLVINGKKMDSGRFLFNFNELTKDEFLQNFITKMDSFFEWYSKFNNKEAISKVELFTNDINCIDGCKVPMAHYISVIDLLIDKKTLHNLLDEHAKKYNLIINISPNEEE